MSANHIISVLVENKAGVLAKISGLFSRRGFNIESLAVGTTEDEKISRITIVVDAEVHSIEQVVKQLYKLINVIKIQELDPVNIVERELVLIKVNADNSTRAEILEIVDIFRANIVDVAKKITFHRDNRKQQEDTGHWGAAAALWDIGTGEDRKDCT